MFFFLEEEREGGVMGGFLEEGGEVFFFGEEGGGLGVSGFIGPIGANFGIGPAFHGDPPPPLPFPPSQNRLTGFNSSHSVLRYAVWGKGEGSEPDPSQTVFRGCATILT